MMRVLWHMLVKEFLQLVRTPALLFVLILCPVVTVGLVPFGLSNKPRIRDVVIRWCRWNVRGRCCSTGWCRR